MNVVQLEVFELQKQWLVVSIDVTATCCKVCTGGRAFDVSTNEVAASVKASSHHRRASFRR
jgi:hypothetical protein